MEYPRNPMVARNRDLMLENKYYKRYLKNKKKIQSKYPESLWEYPLSRTKYNKEEKKMWLKYIKELGDLMYKKNGWFQKFVWDSVCQSTKDRQEIFDK